jgi:hypothetical protein
VDASKAIDQQKQAVKPVPIWRCKEQSCKAWIRTEMADADSPACPICKGAMIRSMKHLPKLVNKIPSAGK